MPQELYRRPLTFLSFEKAGLFSNCTIQFNSNAHRMLTGFSCHSAEGQGSKDGYYPSLFRNSATGAKSAINLVAAILYGVDRATSERQAFMPGFGGRTTDANVLSDRELRCWATMCSPIMGQLTPPSPNNRSPTNGGVAPPLHCSRSPAPAWQPRRSSCVWALPFLSSDDERVLPDMSRAGHCGEAVTTMIDTASWRTAAEA